MRNPPLYLRDILESIELIEQFVADMELEDFKKDVKTSDAVIKRFENIGEAAKNIPEQIKSQYPEIPWKEMAGMRDKLVHFYFGVKHERSMRLAGVRNSIFDNIIN
ncbi:MAG: DUF86 domain-containing protein [Nitrospirae bacterium]|nr:DUF86 domain-containing protein [Nitrospirota bacterium]